MWSRLSLVFATPRGRSGKKKLEKVLWFPILPAVVNAVYDAVGVDIEIFSSNTGYSVGGLNVNVSH
ncbi:MAG: hypothetical protein CM15mP8_1250 [Methanobacteriota archaeon]|nr:MAG: hypothetical protein CM15mP8_1250 [Euryarchaeota archaeon]